MVCFTMPSHVKNIFTMIRALQVVLAPGRLVESRMEFLSDALEMCSYKRQTSITRLLKTPLKQLGETNRLALLALEDTHAQPLGIDTLTLELSGLTRPAKQGALWPQKERLEQAVAAVEARFPKALLKGAATDPYALASEHAFHLIVRSTGEEINREATITGS